MNDNRMQLIVPPTAKLFVNTWLLLCMCSALVSCSGPVIIPVQVRAPATSGDAAKLRTVAILPFSGKGGEALSSEIAANMTNLRFDDKPYFTVVDRARVSDALTKAGKNSSEASTDPKMAIQIGKLVGATGVYSGALTKDGYEDVRYNEPREECDQYATRLIKGIRYSECVHMRQYMVECTKRVYLFGFTPTVVEVATGTVAYSMNAAGAAESYACSDKGVLQSAIELATNSKAIAMNRFMASIAPHMETLQLTLMDGTDGLSKEAKDKLAAGIVFAQSNRMDRACDLWGSVKSEAISSPSLSYDLGVCSEMNGDYIAALDLYKKADKMLSKPDERISVALARGSEALTKQAKLQEQMGQ